MESSRILDNIPRVKEVVVGARTYVIHCYRFAVKSDFFFIMLTQDFAEKKMKKIKLNGVDEEIFDAVYMLFNTGKVKLTFEDVVPVYIACRYLLVKDIYLQDLLELIRKNMQHLDYFSLLEFCVVNCDDLLDDVIGFIAPNAEALSNHPSFLELSADGILAIIMDRRMKIKAEDSICWILAKWLIHCPARAKYVPDILKKIAPSKFHTDFQLNFLEDEWNLKQIADIFWYYIFEWKLPIRRPLRSEFFKSDEPLYLSNEDGVLNLTHFEGSQWSVLDGPRSQLKPSTHVLAGARQCADLFVGVSDFDSSFHIETSVLYYSFRSKKMIKIAQPIQEEMKGLHFINQKLYSNTRDYVQQYCPEHNLWLNPIDIGLSHYQFSTTDAESLVVCGHYDWSGHNSIHFYDPRIPEWIYFADVPQENQGTCGTFIGDDLFMVALGYNPKNWKVLKLDVRNSKWETVVSHWARSTATPVSIKQCKKDLVIMDHHQNTLTTPINGNKLTFYSNYKHILKHVYSVD